jgi:hypothetical protein
MAGIDGLGDRLQRNAASFQIFNCLNELVQ